MTGTASSPPATCTPSILLVEDDAELASLACEFLLGEGNGVVITHSAMTAWEMLNIRDFDVLVIDVLLPGMNGLDLCRMIRHEELWTPVIMVTALATIEDRLAGFRAGVDDYLVKPFSLAELQARIGVQLRRAHAGARPPIVWGPYRLDYQARRVWHDGVEIVLSGREFAVFSTLVEKAGYVVSRSSLLQSVWKGVEVDRNNVEQHILRLRRKLNRSDEAAVIETIRGLGYRLRESPAHRDVT